MGEVIAELRQHCALPVVIVDDASTDNTIACARAAGATVLPLVTRLGAWGGIQTGIRYALAHGFEYVVTMDADGQHEAEYLVSLANPVVTGKVDVAIGAYVARASRMRKIGWMLLRAVSGLGVDDITSGFRVYNRKAMELLAQENATLLEYQDIGVLFLLCNKGLRIGEYQVSMRPRRAGASRVYSSWRLVIYYMLHSMLLGASKRGRRRCVRVLNPDVRAIGEAGS